MPMCVENLLSSRAKSLACCYGNDTKPITIQNGLQLRCWIG